MAVEHQAVVDILGLASGSRSQLQSDKQLNTC